MVPMISNFLLVRVTGFRVDIKLFTQLRFILDLIRAMKHGNMDVVRVFRNTVAQHFKGIVQRYGPGIVIPKNHVAAAHLADQFEAEDYVFDILPVERLHQIPKGFGSTIKNLEIFEKSVLVRCLAHQRELLRNADERTRLLGAIHVEFSVRFSNAIYVNGLTITKDDVVLLDSRVLVVVHSAGLKPNNRFFLLCFVCDRIAERCGAATARKRAVTQQFDLHDIKVDDVQGWRELVNGDLEVLLPLV